MIADENGLLGFVPCGWVIPSRRIVIILKTKTLLRNVGKHLPQNTAQQTRSLVPQCENKFATNKKFSAVPFAEVSAPVVQHDLAAPSYFSLPFSVSLIIQTTRSVAVIIAALLTFKRRADN